MREKRSILATLFFVLALFLIIYLFRYEPSPTAQSPSVRGITPGFSSTDDVIKVMGLPSEVLECAVRVDGFNIVDRLRLNWDCNNPDTKVYMYEVPTSIEGLAINYEIHLHREIVHQIVVDHGELYGWHLLSPFNLEALLLSVEDVLDSNGDPQELGWSRIAPGTQVMLYCDIGKMIHVHDFDGAEGQDYEAFAVVQVFFQPMKLRECKHEFFLDFSEEKLIFEPL